eukprot:XP_011601019.1 PREDICTED: LETM1 domain-containing protein 1 [Takifugu rubripes]
MALSCPSLFSNLSLMRLCIRTKIITNGYYSHHLSCFSRSSLSRHYSSSSVRRSVGRYVQTRLQRLNSKYESFLKMRFPRFYQLYHTFMEGFKLLFHDAKEVQRIKTKMITSGVQFQDLPYRDMEKLRQVRRDLIKAIPLVLITIPPLANYLVFVMMYFFPRQILIPQFWTPRQQVEFRGVYHSLRARHHWPVIAGLQNTGRRIKEGQLQGRLLDLCAKLQSGQHPAVSEVLAVRGLFSKRALAIKRMKADHMVNTLAPALPDARLPGFLVGRRLNSHALELLQLDRALARLGPPQLTDSEIREACYLRGINSYGLHINQCREWLSQWLQVSSSLNDRELSLLLHSLVFLSANYPTGSSQLRN